MTTEAANSLKGTTLVGKSNYFEWRRKFDRVAKIKDLWHILTSTEKLLSEPKISDFTSLGTGVTTRAGAAAANAAANTTVQTDPHESAIMLAAWQAAHKSYEKQQDKIKQCRELIMNSVSSSILMELEDLSLINDPKQTMLHIKKTYALSNDKAREQLLEKVNALKLQQGESITDYINKHRELKYDLIRAGMTTYSDTVMATHIMTGLPNSYATVKEQWDWMRAVNPEGSPDIQVLQERLLLKEEDIRRNKANSGNGNGSGNGSGSGNGRGGRGRNGSSAKDKSENPNADKQCAFADCGRKGHTEDECWIKNKDLKPQWIKDREAKKDAKSKANDEPNSGRPKQVNAMAIMDRNAFAAHLDAGHDRTNNVTHEMSHKIPIYQSVPTCETFLHCNPSAHASPAPTSKAGEGRDGHGKMDENEHVKPNWDLDLDRAKAIFMAAESENFDPATILLDSGANGHIFRTQADFDTLTFFRENVNTAQSATPLIIEGGGKVTITLVNETNEETELSLAEVAYAPGVFCNLVSLSELGRKGGLSGTWDKSQITIKLGEHTIGVANTESGLYVLQTKRRATTAANIAAVVNFEDKLWTWHRRLGHLSWQSMRNLLRISDGIDLTDEQVKAGMNMVCPVCATTKALVRIPRDPARRRSENLGDLMHADSWGPYPVEGYNGTKYIYVLVDDATRYTWMEEYNTATQLPDVFKALHRRIEKEHNCVIRSYRFDGEYQTGEIAKWLRHHAVTTQPTIPYQHYMNGVAERTMRTAREKAAAMFQETSISGQLMTIMSEKTQETLRGTTLPENLWPTAWEHAVWLKNRSPTRALKGRTPWEALNGQKPDMTRERIYGSRAYVTLPPEVARDRAPKIHAPRGWMGYYVGSVAESIYQVYSPEKHRVFRVGAARVDDGVGLNDPHDKPSLTDRVRPPNVLPTRTPTDKGGSHDTDLEELTSSRASHNNNPNTSEEVAGKDPILIPDDPDFWDNSDEEIDLAELSDYDEDVETIYDKTNRQLDLPVETQSDSEPSSAAEVRVVSRFFAIVLRPVVKCSLCFQISRHCGRERPYPNCIKHSTPCRPLTLYLYNKYNPRTMFVKEINENLAAEDIDLETFPKCS